MDHDDNIIQCQIKNPDQKLNRTLNQKGTVVMKIGIGIITVKTGVDRIENAKLKVRADEPP